ncbi:MAG: septum site-determining protein MinC [Calothrix sp. MO_192.B10]|nr:septum site-determining protein MinC [Calothrix sp. MO_192.B10]
MNSDSATPNINSNSAFSDPETDDNPILPEAEVNSVLQYLRSNPIAVDNDAQTHKIHRDLLADEIETNKQLSDATAEDVDTNKTPPASSTSSTPSASPTENGGEKNQLLDLDATDLQPLVNLNKKLQVQLKREDGKLLLILPPESQVPTSEASLSSIWQQLKLRLNAGDRLQSSNTPVYLVAGNRLLDVRHLQELGEILGEHQMQLKSLSTSRRQTAIAAATAGYSVQQVQIDPLRSQPQSTDNLLADALYLEMTVRSGVEIRHPGSVIILGDVNPGGNLVADGDILVWGRLRGIAHAGARGNRHCLIMALQMEPTQLRIADAVARAPEKSPTQFYPEVAYIAPEGIRIAKTNDFSRPQFANLNLPDEE